MNPFEDLGKLQSPNTPRDELRELRDEYMEQYINLCGPKERISLKEHIRETYPEDEIRQLISQFRHCWQSDRLVLRFLCFGNFTRRNFEKLEGELKNIEEKLKNTDEKLENVDEKLENIEELTKKVHNLESENRFLKQCMTQLQADMSKLTAYLVTKKNFRKFTNNQ